MSSQLQIQQNNYNLGIKDWKCTLSNASMDTLVLKYIPDGWVKNEVEYKRSETYHGIFRSISVKELKFVKDGKDFIQSVYETQGVDAEILVRFDRRNKSTHVYELYHIGKIDLSTYKINETEVGVSMIDTGFNEKFSNRDTVELNMNSDESIDGDTLTPLDDEYVTFPDTSVDLQSNFTATSQLVSTTPHVIPVTLNTSDFTETQTPGTTAGDVGKKTGSFFKENTQLRTLTLDVSVAGSITGTGTIKIDIVVIDDSEVEVYRREIGQATGTGSITPITETFDYTLPVDYSLNFQGLLSGGATAFNYSTVSLDCDEVYEGTPEVSIFGYHYDTAFLKASQIMTGEANPFYSDFLGRTDSQLTTYDTDGQIGFVTRGIYLRQMWEYLYPMSIKFQDLFKSLSNVFNLGLTIEKQSGVNKIRVEDLSYFYNDTQILDLSDRIRVQDIEKAVEPTMIYNEIETGYNSYSYEKTDGLWEYNTKTNFSSIIKSVNNKLSILSPYRADNQGIRNIIKAKYEPDYDETEDVKGDDDNFIVDAYRDGSDFVVRTDEGFTDIGGSVYADKSFNLMLTPKRNLLRHGYKIRSGLVHNSTSTLKWQSSDKNTQLFTQLTAEASPLVENADITVSDLDSPIWYAEIYNVSAYLTVAEKTAIDNNPHGLVKLDVNKYAWIKSLKTSNDDGKAEFELIRKINT